MVEKQYLLLGCQEKGMIRAYKEFFSWNPAIEHNTDMILIGNPVLDLVVPPSLEAKKSLIDAIRTAVIHRGAQALFLFTHTSCDFYRLRGLKYSTIKEDWEVKWRHLREAETLLRDELGQDTAIYTDVFEQDASGKWRKLS